MTASNRKPYIAHESRSLTNGFTRSHRLRLILRIQWTTLTVNDGGGLARIRSTLASGQDGRTRCDSHRCPTLLGCLVDIRVFPEWYRSATRAA